MSQLVLSFKTATTLTAYRVVAPSAAHTVAYPSTNAAVMPCGITIDTASDALRVPVAVNGVAPLLMNQTVAPGGIVTFDDTGRGLAFTPGATTGALTVGIGMIGLFVDEQPALTGTISDVLILPGLVR